jgi:hypothetical protein
MPTEDRFQAAFRQLRRDFPAKTKRSFLADLEGQIEEDDVIQNILRKRGTPRYVAVTFDRRKNDATFSYGYFDLILVVLDAVSGGVGIYKPCSQLRALQWNSTRPDLKLVLTRLAHNNAQIKYLRTLILPFPFPPVGHRFDKNIYLK